MATLAHCLDDDERAFALNTEAVGVLMATANQRELGFALNNLGLLNAHKGDFPLGVRRLKKSLVIGFEVGADPLTMVALESLAEVACLQERFERGVRLIAAANAGRTQTGAALCGQNKMECEELLDLARCSLSAADFESASR